MVRAAQDLHFLELRGAYWYFFGLKKTLVFLAMFLTLSLLLHLLYRGKTKAWRQTWHHFIVAEENDGTRPRSIGTTYYFPMFVNLTVLFVLSQLM